MEFNSNDLVSLPHEKIPSNKEIKFTIGRYQILDSIGKGGMGEVFLAYDPICGRRIALKRIRPDMIVHKQMHKRFLREARITSQLTHPAIIPIYAIKIEQDLSYYTMPYVEGKTLKDILSFARQQEKLGAKPDHLSSIPSLIRIFLNVCQAIAYSHSKGVIHRDIKPNNIIVGRYGEVLILDWGLAKLIQDQWELTEDLGEDEEKLPTSQDETRAGRIVGTVAYLAPERAFGQQANYQTDIYSLGVILYQILTLHHPFHRKSLSEFREKANKEILIEPSVIAPYRDVPPILAHIAIKCLQSNVKERFQTVEELSNALESYLEGKSEWFKNTSLSPYCKSDWEFQENVLTVEHMAISRGTDVSDWVFLMISKASFFGNIKIQASIKIGERGHGIGFLINIPEANKREHPTNGFCLWISSDLGRSTRLLRENAEIMAYPDIFIPRHQKTDLCIERIGNSLHFYLNGSLQFSYTSHLPLNGTHIGLITRDMDFIIDDLTVYVGSQNITINCLAVPDAFLEYKNFSNALNEYRRIAQAFPGTAEAREAMFRAGLSLLEEAKAIKDPSLKQKKLDESLEEFEKLRGTPGAPLEYIGKALVYQTMGEFEEEVKCFELAHRRYPNHPLLPILREQLIYRMLDCSKHNRKATYAFVLLMLRHFFAATTSHNVRKLISSLKKNWEPLYFIDEHSDIEASHDALFSIQLAFWLNKPYVLMEIIDDLLKCSTPHLPSIANALFCLIELEKLDLAYSKVTEIKQSIPSCDLDLILFTIEIAQNKRDIRELESCFQAKLNVAQARSIIYLMEQAAINKDDPKIAFLYTFKERIEDPHSILQLENYYIWSLLHKRDFKQAQAIFLEHPLEHMTDEKYPLYFLYGCWLFLSEGSDLATIHFSTVFDTAYPRSWNLFSHFFNSNEKQREKMFEKAFFWEKKQLLTQLYLFNELIGETGTAHIYKKKLEGLKDIDD